MDARTPLKNVIKTLSAFLKSCVRLKCIRWALSVLHKTPIVNFIKICDDLKQYMQQFTQNSRYALI